MTTADDDVVLQLAHALSAVNAKPKLNASRIVRSTLHDANYHVAMIACAMLMHADMSTPRRILAAWLKLLQFVAARPALVENLLEYSRTRRSGDLQKWSLMPRGYMGDKTHDATVDFLVAAGVLMQEGDHLQSGPRIEVLQNIVTQIEEQNLFEGERAILTKLREIRPTKVFLGGA